MTIQKKKKTSTCDIELLFFYSCDEICTGIIFQISEGIRFTFQSYSIES